MRNRVVKEKKCVISNKLKSLIIVYELTYLLGMGLAGRDQQANKDDIAPTRLELEEQILDENLAYYKNLIVLASEVDQWEIDRYQASLNALLANAHYIKPVKNFPVNFIDPEEEEEQEDYCDLTREEKLALVLDYHGIESTFQYYQIVSTLANEGGPNNYDECYDVLCTAYNRTLSKESVRYLEAVNKNDDGTKKDGTKIANQLLWRAQFSGFLPSKAGHDRDKYEGTEADRAALDFLFGIIVNGDAARSHDYLYFNAPWYEYCPSFAIQLNPECAGNAYFGSLEENDLNQKAEDLGVVLGLDRRSDEFRAIREAETPEEAKEYLKLFYDYDSNTFTLIR